MRPSALCDNTPFSNANVDVEGNVWCMDKTHLHNDMKNDRKVQCIDGHWRWQYNSETDSATVLPTPICKVRERERENMLVPNYDFYTIELH